MFRERLELLIGTMRQVEHDEKLLARFDMGHWLGEPKHTCGTSACALGYAALDPALQAEGLIMQFLDHDTKMVTPFTTDAEFLALAKAAGPSGYYASPIFEVHEGFTAGRHFFGITIAAADYLFDPSNYGMPDNLITPGDVIERIERVIAADGSRPADDDDDDDC